jgi:uncharacterized protein YdaL
MDQDRFGYGQHAISNEVKQMEHDFHSIGIKPLTPQKKLWKIYEQAEKDGNIKVTSIMDKWWDSWN